MIIKIYGERNTGTNYLMQLLRNHLNILAEFKEGFIIPSVFSPIDASRLEKLGWKHRLASAEFLENQQVSREEILIITLTKNPYSWLLSLNKRSYAAIHLRTKVKRCVRELSPSGFVRRSKLEWRFIHFIKRFGRSGQLFLSRYPRWCEYEKLAFSDFIRAKWFSRFDEGKDEGYKNAVTLWNEKNRAYLELAKHYKVKLLTYEELLISPELVIEKIIEDLGGTKPLFKNVYLAAKEEDKQTKDYDYYRDYYLQEHWREKLKPQDIKWINAYLDKDVMKAFGYSLL